MLFLFVANVSAQEDMNFQDVEIQYEKFVLDNGLTVIVHQDHKAPIVAVNIWYHVGSKNEKFGKTGFAHLFEHLMFNGSENFNDDYFKAMEKVGSTDLNGTTGFDRTNYFENVPVAALDVALWMESDRMGHFANAISQEKLDEQRKVVKNEKRQGDNQPYGKFFYQLTNNCFPSGHPYNHTVIGSMDDLEAASLDDVKKWFNDYYGAANAVICIAGDIDTNVALEKVKKYFGDIPSGPPVTKQEVNIAKRTGTIREVMEDRVSQSRIYQVWNVPEWGNDEAFLLDFASSALAGDKNSRLYKRLVYDEQIASSVTAYNWESEIAGMFVIQVDVKPGVANEIVEKAIDEELTLFLKEGPTDKEMMRTKTKFYADFVRGAERIGGFGGKSDILARNEVYGGSPDFYKVRNKGMKEATASKVKRASNKWLNDGKYILTINPFPKYDVLATKVDRSKGLPDVGESADVKFPDLQKATLSNGMQIYLARRTEVPLVQFRLLVDAGYASDQFALPGTASLAMNMMDEGTTNRNSLQINEELALLGAKLNTGSSLDMSYISLNALKANLDKSLELYADVILNPAFPKSDFKRLQKEQIVGIQREKMSPVNMALRVFPKFMYGSKHAYALPFTGSGYEKSVADIERDHLVKFYKTWLKPNNATMIVVGDITMDEVKSKLEETLGSWKKGKVPEKNLAKVEPKQNNVYLIDRPDSKQSVIIAGHITLPSGSKEDISIDMMNTILGGKFTSRINMNLREEKGWTYGARTIIIGAKGQRPLIAYAPVQADKTSESMVEIKKEMQQYLDNKPATEEEFKITQKNAILSLPGRWETLASVGYSIERIVKYNLSEDYYQKYSGEIHKLTLDNIHEAAGMILKPNHISWVVVGDRAKIEKKIKELGYGEIIIIDSDGNILDPDDYQVQK